MALTAEIKNIQVKVGDTIRVKHRFFQGDKAQSQTFQGVVIRIKGRGAGQTFTVRKISADAIGVEKIWPIHSPNLTKLTVVKTGNVRRAKLYYLRKRIGKTALKVKS